MTAIIIPAAVFESPEYAQLSNAERLFLIDLYIVMNDVERFTIDIGNPTEYRQTPGVWLPHKITALLRSGLLIVDDKRNARRVFRFKFSPLGELQAAA